MKSAIRWLATCLAVLLLLAVGIDALNAWRDSAPYHFGGDGGAMANRWAYRSLAAYLLTATLIACACVLALLGMWAGSMALPWRRACVMPLLVLIGVIATDWISEIL
ncbi:hypothetical protein [Cupriavidus sp. U2]|uniref:hypothetical protein n=1 Tax=Cupriavidus sp. U2 TaxID=2920269 RepID=UPI00129E1254|nr:hypothetical protein [Cupriavidus sp. U2]